MYLAQGISTSGICSSPRGGEQILAVLPGHDAKVEPLYNGASRITVTPERSALRANTRKDTNL